MNTKTVIALVGLLTAVVISTGSYGVIRSQVASSDCIGKVYGTPGCPVKSFEEQDAPKVVPPNCGDAILDPDEECDEGRFNGSSFCSNTCDLYYCGDEQVSPHIGEGCEPEIQEIYVLDPLTNQLIIEERFVEPNCGVVCIIPVCDELGECNPNRCTYDFTKPACEDEQLLPAAPGPTESDSGKDTNPLINLFFPQTSQSNDSSDGQEAQGSVCGNAIIEFGEACDDGNTSNFDGCTMQCTVPRCGDGVIEGFEFCDSRGEDSNSCNANCTKATCGDGYRNKEAGEECDDGNEEDADSCTNECKKADCGDGIVQSNEACDDGNGDDADACRNNCTKPRCGDGILTNIPPFYEQCDDGNFINNDDCPNSCRVPVCGNKIKEGREKCDDGNQIDFDTCRNDCTTPYCGDGIVTTVQPYNEQCDDGNRDNEDSCNNGCKKPRCGDAIVQVSLNEECDDGNTVNSDVCSNECRRAACGDAIVQKGEECDDGNKVDTDSCSNACEMAYCGDSVIQPGEQCDDGNDVNDDSCSNRCVKAVCGDSIIQSNEECDDGNAIDIDSCSNICTVPFCGNNIVETSEECDDGNENNLDSCMTNCLFPSCGNGFIEGSEECDDGNLRDGDGCDDRCGIETICGDGRVDGIEECDAGSLNSNTESDACRLNCREAFCGDSVVDTDLGEVCDSTEGCTTECRYPTFMAAHSNSIWGSVMVIILSGGGVVAYLFRKKLMDLTKMAAESVRELSLDDIPLDELEMPWHKWDGKK